MKYQMAKGVFDLLPRDPSPEGAWREVHLWHYVEGIVREIAKEYSFSEIRTPLFEPTELFVRSIGSATDIVSKEMYTFFDKANRSLSLRPEGTAPVMRSLIEKKILVENPLQKLYYLYPMFRYERKQAGRYRQHHQFGVEAIGSGSPFQDVEVIDLLYSFFVRLGLQGLTLHLNSIGNEKTRTCYRAALKAYLQPKFNTLSPESQERFESNPLRILDSKDLKDQEALQKAPSILEFLESAEQDHFEKVCSLLKAADIPFVLNSRLVRGLDYYNNTVFEITAEELGAQNALGGGGRYDGLIKELGGLDLPAVGFGAGLERIIQTCLNQKVFFPSFPHPLLYIIPLGEEAQMTSFKLLRTLRKQHLCCDIDLSGKKLKGAMRRADVSGAKYVAVIGENELKSGLLSLKEMQTGLTQKIPLQTLPEVLKNV